MMLAKEHKLRVVILFVDESLGAIYGGFLDKLIEPYNNYPMVQEDRHDKKQIFFHMKQMKVMRELTPEEIEAMKELSSEYDSREVVA